MWRSAKREYRSETSERQLTPGAPCCRYKRLTIATFWRPEGTDWRFGTHLLWASARRAGVKQLLTEDLQDGFALQGVTFINPFKRQNHQLIDEILPPS